MDGIKKTKNPVSDQTNSIHFLATRKKSFHILHTLQIFNFARNCF